MKRACIIFTVALGLTVCISVLFCSTEPIEIQAATGSFTIPETTPTPSPTPTLPPTPTPTVPPPTPTPEPSPTPTATPTVSPTPTPTTAGGDGSSQPSISLKLFIDIMGQKTEWLRNSTGKVLEDVVAPAPDGKITLQISRGTFALDADGAPLTQIYITWVDPFVKAPPPENQFIYMYELWPDEATFSQPIDIIINYDPSDLPKSPDQLVLRMYSFDNIPNEWEEIPCLVDIGKNTVLLSVSHLSIYVLSAEPLPDQSPVPQPSPKPPATSSLGAYNNWILFILILPAASLAFFIYVLFRWRRSIHHL